MKKVIIFMLILNSAFALSVPKKSTSDNRINYINYNANDVTLIKASVGYVTMLRFDNDERTINIATGFSDGWEIQAKENFVFIKPNSYGIKQEEQELVSESGKRIRVGGSSIIHPKNEDWKTNLIITTNKRIYNFDLTLTDENNLNYQINFDYKAQKEELEKTKKELELRKERKDKENLKVQTELNRVNIPRNYAFLMHINKDSDDIAPNFAYDDGVHSYFGFDTTKTIPSVFIYDEANGEIIANSHLEKNGKFQVLVIHQTSKQFLFRSGNKLVGIKNEGYAKNPLDKTYETKSVNVDRTTK